MRGPVGIWIRNTQTQQTHSEGETDTQGRIKMWFERGRHRRDARDESRGKWENNTINHHWDKRAYWNIRTLDTLITALYMPCALGAGKCGERKLKCT